MLDTPDDLQLPAKPTTPLIDVTDLRRLLDSGQQVVLLDVRWQLGRTDGYEQYRQGHLPGAVFVDLDAELSAPPSDTEGRHPLPHAADLQSSARRWGISADSVVVTYDDSGHVAAARAWWLLRWGGLEEVFILDGGLAAWREAGGELPTDDVAPAPGEIELSGGMMPIVDADSAGVWARQAIVLDARPATRYAGGPDPYDPRPGHIPGAHSAPSPGNLGIDGRFRSAEELRHHYAEIGIWAHTPVAVYCGSGVTATQTVAALASIGVDAALYPGSWSQWSRDDARPVATGPEAG